MRGTSADHAEGYPAGSSGVEGAKALSFSSSNLASMVGLPRVSFLIVTSWALSLARPRLRPVPRRASLVFCRWVIDLSIFSIAV